VIDTIKIASINFEEQVPVYIRTGTLLLREPNLMVHRDCRYLPFSARENSFILSISYMQNVPIISSSTNKTYK